MKTLATLLAVMALSLGVASAQDLSGNANSPMNNNNAVDVTGFRAPAQLGPGASQSTKPNVHPNLKPKLGGIFVDGAKYGTQLINPAAPASYGMGEKYLTAPASGSDLQHESGPAAHRQSGGLKLFSLEF